VSHIASFYRSDFEYVAIIDTKLLIIEVNLSSHQSVRPSSTTLNTASPSGKLGLSTNLAILLPAFAFRK
jgi:hypothetical protein